MTDLERLWAIRERRAAATPGPWYVGELGYTIVSRAVPVERHIDESEHGVAYCRQRGDVEFVAHSRADVEWLLGLVSTLEHELAVCRFTAMGTSAGGNAMIGRCNTCQHWDTSIYRPYGMCRLTESCIGDPLIADTLAWADDSEPWCA